MNTYSADLHIHTVLSPCGDLEMSPVRIVDRAVQKGLDIIAVCDHNHTGHCKVTRELGEKKGLWVVYGVEVTTREEVHCLAFFDTIVQLEKFQAYIDRYIPIIANDVAYFGEQLIVDENEVILEEVKRSLYPGLKQGINEVANKVSEMGGYFVPAHIDRVMNGIYSQLGIFPDELKVDAVEIYRNTERAEIRKNRKELETFQLLKSSDAHFVEDIGRSKSYLVMKERNFEELGMALRGEDGRKILEL